MRDHYMSLLLWGANGAGEGMWIVKGVALARVCCADYPEWLSSHLINFQEHVKGVGCFANNLSGFHV